MKTINNLLDTVKNIIIGLLLIVILTQGMVMIKRFIESPSELSDSQSPILTESDFKVGLSLGTLKEERWLKDRDILMAKIRELGGECIVVNANNDDDDQLRQVKYLVSQKIDVLVIVPNDMKKAATSVEYAKSHGVKVISYDRLVLDSNIDVYISFNNERVGEEMGSYIRSKLSSGNVLIINGAQSDYNTTGLKKGYDNSLNSPGIKIIGEFWADQWLNEFAYDKTEFFLKKGIKIDAVLAGNDALAGAVIRALTEYRLAGNVIVVGQDADLEACQRIVRGTQNMTIYKPIDKLAEVAAKVCKELAYGDLSTLSEASIMENGKFSIPYLFLEPTVVDKDNLEQTILKDGFHIYDELFK